MARGSRDDRRTRRALDELGAAAKQLARGQRVDALAVVDAYLVLDAEELARQSSLQTATWKIVGAALDEIAKRPPANTAITAWMPRLDKAPELVRAPTEPADIGPARWWALTRAALAGRLYSTAAQGWRHLSAEAHARAPRLASLIEAWLTPPHVLTDDQIEAVSVCISRLQGQPPATIGARSTDPRLGYEGQKPAAKLPLDASNADIVQWVERVAAGTTGLASQVRASARPMAPARAAMLWAEAAPFLLREALHKDAPEVASQLAEALEAQRVAGFTPTRALLDDLDLAYRWLGGNLAQITSRGSEATKSLLAYSKVALAAVTSDARHRVPAMRALSTVPIQAVVYSEPLQNLIVALLEPDRNQPATAPPAHADGEALGAFWLWVLAVWDPDVEADDVVLIEAVEGVVDAVMRSPGVVTKTLNRMTADVRVQIYECITMSFAYDLVIRFSTWLLPLLPPTGRFELLNAVLDFTNTLDDEERGSETLPPELRADLDALLEDGLSPRKAVDQLLAGAPQLLRVNLRDELIAYATAPRVTSPVTSALWSELGPEAIKHSGRVWAAALRHANTSESRRRLIEIDTRDVANAGEWAERAHAIFNEMDTDAFDDLMWAFINRFGPSIEALREAFRRQERCPCRFLLGFAYQIIKVEHLAGLPDSPETKSARRLFPDACKRFERALEGAAARTKSKAASKKSTRGEPAEKPPSKKRSDRASAEGAAGAKPKAKSKAKAKAETKAETKKPTETDTKKPTEADKKKPTEADTKKPTKAETKKPTKAKAEAPVADPAPETKKRARTPKAAQIALPIPPDRGSP